MNSSEKNENKSFDIPLNNLTPKELASFYLDRNLSVIPLKYREKTPLFSWKEYQERRPTREEIEKWFSNNEVNVAIITGSVSDNLIVIDFDNMELAKWFFDEVLPKLPRSIQFSVGNTWMVRTGKGVHIYLRITDIERDEFKEKLRTKPRLREGLDIKAEGGYVVAPPSIHPSGAKYHFIKNDPMTNDIKPLTFEEYEKLLDYLAPQEEIPKTDLGKRVLTEEEISRTVELIKPAYKQGYRDLICFYLSGWMRKAGITYESARKVIELLTAIKEDEERDQRLYNLDRHYGLRGNPPTPEEMKGKTGLQEILEKSLNDEESALEIIRQLEDIFGMASPFRDSIFEILDYQRPLFAVANLRRGVIARATLQRQNDGRRTRVVYRERISPVAPIEVTIYRDPTGMEPDKFKVVFDGIKSFVAGPTTVDEIIQRLKEDGLVFHSRLINDVLPAILRGFERKGKAKLVYSFVETGYFLLQNERERKIIWNEGTVRLNLPETVDINKARRALEILDEFVREYCKCEKPQVTAIKLIFATPFGHVRKTLGRNQQSIAFAGERDTYKTTIAMIGPYLVGLDKNNQEVWRSGYVTYPQLANACSRHTGCFVINEAPLDFLTTKNAEQIAYLKACPESLMGRFLESDKKPRKALATVIMTFNDFPTIGDPNIANPKRLLLVRFENREKIEQGGRELIEKAKEEFWHLAKFLADHINEIPLELFEKEMWEVGEHILTFLYEKLLGKVPEWVRIKIEPAELDPSDRLVEEAMTPDILFAEMLIEDVMKVCREYKIIDDMKTLNWDDVEQRKIIFEQVLGLRAIPYCLLKEGKNGELYVWILPTVRQYLRKKYSVALTLPDLKNALGGKIEPRRITKGRQQKVLVLEFDKLMTLLESILRKEEYEEDLEESIEQPEEPKEEPRFSNETEEKIYELVERAGGEAGVIWVIEELKNRHGIRLSRGQIKEIINASKRMKLGPSGQTIKIIS